MTILGNICIALALFLYAVPFPLMLRDPSSHRNDGGAVWGAIFVLGPLWLLLTVALAVIAGKGGLGWAFKERGWQVAVAIMAGISLFLVTVISVLGRSEPASQLPWGARLFTSWAALVLPLVAIVFCLLAL